MQLNHDLVIRKATQKDLPAIVAMLADDVLGQQREHFSEPVLESYQTAFADIQRDTNNHLMVLEFKGEIIGAFQLLFIPSLSFKGRMRAQIESVRIKSNYRGKGYGKLMFNWAIAQAKEKGCHVVQLITNIQRADAKRFYESLGFQAIGVGMKLHL